MMLRALPGWAMTLLVLLACWPAWMLGGWIAAAAGLFVLDLPIRLALVVLLLGLLAGRIDRADEPPHSG